MKIAVPLSQAKFCDHFGGAEAFAFYTVNVDDRSIGERLIDSPPEHGRGVYPMWLHRLGATVVLAGGMGPRAVVILARHGIETVLGVKGEDPDAIVQSYLEGSLSATNEACRDHGFHDCGHDHPRGVQGDSHTE